MSNARGAHVGGRGRKVARKSPDRRWHESWPNYAGGQARRGDTLRPRRSTPLTPESKTVAFNRREGFFARLKRFFGGDR